MRPYPPLAASFALLLGGCPGEAPSADRFAADAAPGPDALAGQTETKGAGNADGWRLRYDAWGNRLWDKRFGEAGKGAVCAGGSCI